MSITLKDFNKCIDLVKDTPNAIVYHDMGELKDGKELVLVFGYIEGYEKDDQCFQLVNGDHIYTLCCKLAINIDDLQSNYNVDWYMPYSTLNGDIYDTDHSILKNPDTSDIKWINDNAKKIIKDYNNGKLKV